MSQHPYPSPLPVAVSDLAVVVEHAANRLVHRDDYWASALPVIVASPWRRVGYTMLPSRGPDGPVQFLYRASTDTYLAVVIPEGDMRGPADAAAVYSAWAAAVCGTYEEMLRWAAAQRPRYSQFVGGALLSRVTVQAASVPASLLSLVHADVIADGRHLVSMTADISARVCQYSGLMPLSMAAKTLTALADTHMEAWVAAAPDAWFLPEVLDETEDAWEEALEEFVLAMWSPGPED